MGQGDHRDWLPQSFPLRETVAEFITEFSADRAYWYVPKARAINTKNVEIVAAILNAVSEHFDGAPWDTDTQDELLRVLMRQRILNPTTPGDLLDRTALVRIIKKFLEFLGLLWVEDGYGVALTIAGRRIVEGEDASKVVQNQLVKYQYPNPTISTALQENFFGLLPHVFLLQILQTTEYRLTRDEYLLFVNLATSHGDLDRISRYIRTWRDLDESQRELVLQAISADNCGASRHKRVSQNLSYQLASHCFAPYLDYERTPAAIAARHTDQIDFVIDELIPTLAIPRFKSTEDWLSYFGDPEQRPNWFAYLSNEIAQADSLEAAQAVLKAHMGRVTQTDATTLERRQIERGVEDFYERNIEFLEDGLTVIRRQYPTTIGPIDLLCRDSQGQYVVVEIKAHEAGDSAFGQVLRYMGWVHHHLPHGQDNVRGIILAREFGDRAHYARIGLANSSKFRVSLKQHLGSSQDV